MVEVVRQREVWELYSYQETPGYTMGEEEGDGRYGTDRQSRESSLHGG